MPALDTNVLVRWLIEDDAVQARRAQQLFESSKQNGVSLYVPSTVALELEWVLRSRYQYDKTTILATFSALLDTQELDFQEEAALERTLHLYRLSTADFADCLHAALCRTAGRVPMFTFDDRAARLPHAQLKSR